MNVPLVAQLEREIQETSTDVRRQNYYPKYTSENQGTRQILNTGGLHHTYSMTPQKTITRYQIPSENQVQCYLSTLIPIVL